MKTKELKLPVHVGIIMDGNGRWAKKRLMPRSYGHRAGMNTMIKLAERAKELGIHYLTVYALSTENLSRPKEELDGLFNLLRLYFTENLKKLYAAHCGVKIIGDLTVLPEDVATLLYNGEKNSPEGAEFILTFAINYGGRAEILNAVNKAIAAGKQLDRQGFEQLLYTNGLPDPDLIIRTGGELRLSNFLTYQSAYAEFYFTDVLFPDFNAKEFDKAIESFSKRDRRFGKTEK
jgi:undecaprenyl diphosphate synthase